MPGTRVVLRFVLANTHVIKTLELVKLGVSKWFCLIVRGVVCASDKPQFCVLRPCKSHCYEFNEHVERRCDVAFRCLAQWWQRKLHFYCPGTASEYGDPTHQEPNFA